MKETDAYPVYYADCSYCGEQCGVDSELPVEHECEYCGETFRAK